MIFGKTLFGSRRLVRELKHCLYQLSGRLPVTQRNSITTLPILPPARSVPMAVANYRDRDRSRGNGVHRPLSEVPGLKLDGSALMMRLARSLMSVSGSSNSCVANFKTVSGTR